MAQNKSIKEAMATSETIRMFKNPFLEKLTHVHPATPFVIYIPVVAYFLYQAWSNARMSVGYIAIHFLYGLLAWTIAEYLLHRFVFHIPQTNAFSKKVYFYLHGIHHDAPNDATRLVMPPSASFPIAIGVYYLVKWITPMNHLPVVAGFIVGYLFYDFMHFATHFYNFKNPYFKYIRRAHMVHHHRASNKNFGFTSPIWDFVFASNFKQPANEATEES